MFFSFSPISLKLTPLKSKVSYPKARKTEATRNLNRLFGLESLTHKQNRRHWRLIPLKSKRSYPNVRKTVATQDLTRLFGLEPVIYTTRTVDSRP